MYCYSARPQVVDPHHLALKLTSANSLQRSIGQTYTADDIAPQIVEHQHLPYRLPIRVYQGYRLREKAIYVGVMLVGVVRGVVVEVQDFFDGGCYRSISVRCFVLRRDRCNHRFGDPEG
jgi:hypothetical protein